MRCTARPCRDFVCGFPGCCQQGRVRAVLVTLVVSLGLVVVATPANAFVYWTNNSSGTIGRANLDGTGVNQSFITGAYVVPGSLALWQRFDAAVGQLNRAMI